MSTRAKGCRRKSASARKKRGWPATMAVILTTAVSSNGGSLKRPRQSTARGSNMSQMSRKRMIRDDPAYRAVMVARKSVKTVSSGKSSSGFPAKDGRLISCQPKLRKSQNRRRPNQEYLSSVGVLAPADRWKSLTTMLTSSYSSAMGAAFVAEVMMPPAFRGGNCKVRISQITYYLAKSVFFITKFRRSVKGESKTIVFRGPRFRGDSGVRTDADNTWSPSARGLRGVQGC